MGSRCRGTTLAELPMGLWVIFVGMGMPLICLMLTVARYVVFMEAANQAVNLAAQAQQYYSSSGSSSAVTQAQDQAVAVASSFSGLTISPENVKCYIVVTPLSSGNSSGNSAIYGPNTMLTKPADPTQNLYQVQVNITGQIQPIISMPGYFMAIPGLNAPLTVQTAMTRVFENPSGLYTASNGS